MKEFGPFAVAIAFWIFVTVAAVAGIVADYKKRRVAFEPLRAAIERGQPLDPALVERLLAPERDTGINPVHLQVGGIITLSAGVGIGLLAFFIYPVAPISLYPVLGGGIVVVCVGLGLVLAARAVARQRVSQGDDARDERQQERRAG
jgi:O-antigen/teichoic acid export membrane protein